jgi:hypothetical protein
MYYIYTVYDRIFGEFPAKNTVYTPYMYGFGQPYIYTVVMAGKRPNLRSRKVYMYGSGQF